MSTGFFRNKSVVLVLILVLVLVAVLAVVLIPVLILVAVLISVLVIHFCFPPKISYGVIPQE